MRTIKFRAWDERRKILHQEFNFIQSFGDGNNWIIPIKPISNPEWIKDLQENITSAPHFRQQFKLMQFIGLRDKNGKEIYEGDIIKECSEGESIWKEFRDEGGIVEKCPIGIVEWDVTGFNVKQIKEGLVKLKNGSNSELHLSKYDGQFTWSLGEGDTEVIGNIYENMELLK